MRYSDIYKKSHWTGYMQGLISSRFFFYFQIFKLILNLQYVFFFVGAKRGKACWIENHAPANEVPSMPIQTAFPCLGPTKINTVY